MQTHFTTPALGHDTPMPDHARCWRAVQERDKLFDGTFVTAVLTTGIYCRPSCPARHPKPENVRFYREPVEAERHGFRPCKRCKPHDVVIDPHLTLVREACALLDQQDEDALTLDVLGQRLGVSPHHLQRTFKQVIGISPRQYAEARRVERVKTQLRSGDDVTTALYDAGYGSSSRLYESAPARLGMTPATYRRGGAGMTISYVIVDSPLGRLLVGMTERGVCLVCLGDADEQLEARLHSEYPNAIIARDGGQIGEPVQAILSYLEGREPRLDLPVDLQATAFQWQVWGALRQIPVGETRSYSEIARSIGRPQAARAVAQACANNPAALIIPCHRVVRNDGASGGYRWGIERKEALLAKERVLAKADEHVS
jgi:AraC family transcriptional regulator, regulatory protein of adaptative response / methylated-DNA-[protein]-cysteine methyltransferase